MTKSTIWGYDEVYFLCTSRDLFTSVLPDGLSLSHIKSPQVSRTFLSILAVLNDVILWIVTTRYLISKSSSPFNNPLVTVPKALITIGVNYYYYYYYYYWEFFTSVIPDSFPLEFEWHYISSSLQDSSQYPGRYQQCWSLESLNQSRSFQVLQFLYKSIEVWREHQLWLV